LNLYILNNINNNDVVNLSLNDNNNIKLIDIENGPYNYDISINKCNSIELLTFTSCREDDEIHWNKLNLINLPNLIRIYSGNVILSANIKNCIKLNTFDNSGIVLSNKIIINNTNLYKIYFYSIYKNISNELDKFKIDFNNNILEQVNNIFDIFNDCDTIINIKISNLFCGEESFDYTFNNNLNFLELSLEEQKNIIRKIYYSYSDHYFHHNIFPERRIDIYDKKFICYERNNIKLILN